LLELHRKQHEHFQLKADGQTQIMSLLIKDTLSLLNEQKEIVKRVEENKNNTK